MLVTENKGESSSTLNMGRFVYLSDNSSRQVLFVF